MFCFFVPIDEQRFSYYPVWPDINVQYFPTVPTAIRRGNGTDQRGSEHHQGKISGPQLLWPLPQDSCWAERIISRGKVKGTAQLLKNRFLFFVSIVLPKLLILRTIDEVQRYKMSNLLIRRFSHQPLWSLIFIWRVGIEALIS